MISQDGYEECQLPGPDVEANMQITGVKAVEVLTMLMPQGQQCPSKGTSFTLTYIRHMVSGFFPLARLNKKVRSVGDMKNASQNVYFSHFVRNLAA